MAGNFYLAQTMAPPPASPTSLLWAHQLKREHGYILKRLQEIEASRESHENRIKTAEQAAKASANNDIAALAKQVNALEGGNWQNRLTELENKITERFNNIEADTEAMTLQMDILERKQDAQEVDVQKALKDGEALLNRIREVDETLQQYRDASTRIGKRIDEAAIGQIKLQLDGLAKQVQQEGSDFKSISESITQMETAQGQLRKAIEKLESDFKKKAAKTSTTPKASPSKPVTGPAIKHKPEGEPRKKAANTPEHTTTKQIPDTGTPNSAERDHSKRKSHKWSGGGADRDIIRQGSDVKKAIPAKIPQFGTEPSEQPTGSSKKTPLPPQPKAKKRVPPARPDGPPVKSHKWAGGGADRDIIAAGVSSHVSDLKRKRSRSMGDELEQPRKRGVTRASEGVAKPTSQSPARIDSSKTKTQRWAESQTTKSITRAGKGWFEVIASPEPEPSR